MSHLSGDTHQRVKTVVGVGGGSPGSHLDLGPCAWTRQRKFWELMKSSEEKTRLEDQMLSLIKWLEEEGRHSWRRKKRTGFCGTSLNGQKFEERGRQTPKEDED